MTSTKKLRNVVNSTVQHSVSGLCFIHPHLGVACKQGGINSISINLLESEFIPKLIKITKELELSTNALRNKFKELLENEAISISEIKSAKIEFQFSINEYPISAYIEVITKDSIKIEHAVDSIGVTAEILNETS